MIIQTNSTNLEYFFIKLGDCYEMILVRLKILLLKSSVRWAQVWYDGGTTFGVNRRVKP